jgi:hypothetical protein
MRRRTAAVCLLLAGCAPSLGDVRVGPTSAAGTGPPGGTPVSAAAAEGPRDAGTSARVTAFCPAGRQAAGGGLLADVSSGAAPSPTLRLDALVPDGPAGWAATVAAGGQAQPAARTRVFALCPESAGEIQEVTATVPGPESAGSARTATARCPSGMVVLAGGGRVDLAGAHAAPRYFFLTASYPSTVAGAPVASGEASAWSAEGAIGGMPLTDGRVSAMAVCRRGTGVSIVAASVRGPSAPAGAGRAVATCPTGTSLESGGGLTGLPVDGSPPQGLHLRGSFPSDPSGDPVPDGGVAGSWSAVANNGGLPSLGVITTAFAVCSRTPGATP